jgi:error-prone DNA polymerase
MYEIPMEDAKTYALIQTGETIGTFQIESRAQINSILHTGPDHLYDIVVQVALIRPGPIQANFVHPYTARRLGKEPVTFLHPDLEEILARTQGIPIFQEQAMAIAMKLGGYTGARADALRRTMGNIRKKGRLEAALVDMRTAMLARAASGAIAPLSDETATRICDDLVSFANYGFPESHAWSFALIAYVTAYLKAHYPTEFFIGALNAQPMGFYPVSTLVHDAKRFGVEVRPPCLLFGSRECTYENGAMRIGWRFVRGIGDTVLDALEAARKEGPFTSIRDVVRRATLDRDEVLAFAQSDAFAAWAHDRRHAAWEGLHASGDVLPLAPAAATQHDPVPITHDELVFLDYHAVGMSIAGHPMASVRDKLVRGGAIDSRDLMKMPNGRKVTIGGLVTVRQRPATAGGTIFLLLEDEWGYANIVVPKPLVAPNEEVVKREPFVLVQGRVENDGSAISIVGQKFKMLDVGALTHRAHEFR